METMNFTDDCNRICDQAAVLKSQARYNDSVAEYDKCILQLEQILQRCPCELEDQLKKINEYAAHVYCERGHVKYLQVEFTDAVKDYTEAIRRDAQLVLAYYNRGLIHYRLGRFEMAVQDMESALNIQPDFESALLCYKQARSDLGKKKGKG